MSNQNNEISIDKVSLEDLSAVHTGNPIAEDEIPTMLRDAIKAGGVVLLTGPDGKVSHKLTLSAQGQFQCIPFA
jgi:hypothetical protein